MLDKIRSILLSLTLRGEDREFFQRVRRLAIAAIKNPGQVRDMVNGMAETEARLAHEFATWAKPDQNFRDNGGVFDACSLQHWLLIADKAGVPAVPARPILTLSQEEMEAAGGSVKLDNPLFRRLARTLRKAFPEATTEEATNRQAAAPAQSLHAQVQEKLADAMDGVPNGWMVRYNRCSASTVKALAGTGLAGPEAPETRFNADLSVGPGWLRQGNRRRVDAANGRIVRAAAEGPDGDHVFLARPWVKAARWAKGRDPHRAGTPLDTPGLWPAEWRCVVHCGRVVGVASYYGWCGSVTPENARMALKVAEMAQAIIDTAKAIGAIPRFPDHELLRHSKHAPDLDAYLPRHEIHCTLDFIETIDGILLLEAGPAYSKWGGGHPCAFAGIEHPTGIAFRTMAHINLADPKTWIDGDRAGAWLDWDAVRQLATTQPDTP